MSIWFKLNSSSYIDSPIVPICPERAGTQVNIYAGLGIFYVMILEYNGKMHNMRWVCGVQVGSYVHQQDNSLSISNIVI